MKLFLDIDNGRLITGINDPAAITDLTLVRCDIVPLTVTIVQVNTDFESSQDLYVPVDLAAGRILFLGAKPATALDGPHFVSQSVWGKTGVGVYTANLQLTDALLLAAMGVNTTVNLLGEFTQVDEGGGNYSSIQFNLTVIPDVTRGGEPLATRVAPSGGIWALVVNDEGEFSARRIA